MTPQDIINKKFERGMGGYKVEDVNAFLIEIGEYIADLQDERADLLQKMEVIAEKLEEYRADEDSLRTALLGAQKLGDSVVRDSKKKAEGILAEARLQADEILAEARRELSTQEQALTQMEGEVSKFRHKILGLYEGQIEMIKKLPYNPEMIQMAPPPQMTAVQEAPQEEEPKGKGFFTLNIDEEDLEEPEIQADAEPVSSNAPGKKKSSRFTDLQFGEKYNLKREE